MEKFKVKVTNKSEVLEIEKILSTIGMFSSDYSGFSYPKYIANNIDGEFSDYTMSDSGIDSFKLITLQELRDMVNPMKEYLSKNSSGNYQLVNHRFSEDDIEVPDGAEAFGHTGIVQTFYKDDFRSFFNENTDGQWDERSETWIGRKDPVILWQRHTQPEELPFIDNEPKEYLREDGNGSYILELTCKQEATEPHAKHWIEVPVGVNFYYSFASGDKVFTKEHSSLGRLLWQRKTYFSLNDQYAEIEQVRQQVNSLPEFKHDFVNHPKHYCDHPSGIECIEITRHHDFAIGNAIKYLWRAGLKDSDNEIQDLKKAVWYVQDKIAQLENK